MRLKTSHALKNIIRILKILVGPKFTEVKRKIAFDFSRLIIGVNYLCLSLLSPCPVNSPVKMDFMKMGAAKEYCNALYYVEVIHVPKLMVCWMLK